MKKKLIQLVLGAIIIVLGYSLYQSIMTPVRFQKDQKKRELVVIGRLIDIRSAQTSYKSMNGRYTSSFDTLIAFVKEGKIPVVKVVADPTDTTFTRTIRDTIAFTVVQDSLFHGKDYVNFDAGQLRYIPFSGKEEFELGADEIEKGGVDVQVFEAKALYTQFLKGMDEATIRNLIGKKEQMDKFPGLKVGSLTEPSTDGNWEKL